MTDLRLCAERFWSKVDFSGGDDGCWIWLGAYSVREKKYRRPVFWIAGRVVLAYRVALALATNGEIPADMDCAHSCDNPSCVNPRHLSWKTHTANLEEHIAKYGAIGAPKLSRPRALTLFEGLEATG